MKKYKLIKEYPGSPNLGTEVNASSNDGARVYKYLIPNSQYFAPYIQKKYVENQSEFWEEVEEKEYEILSIISNYKKINDIVIFSESGLMKDSLEECGIESYVSNSLTNEEAVKNWTIDAKTWNIHSVKRLSDGEVFTIGDKVSNNGQSCTLNKITVDPVWLYYSYDSGSELSKRFNQTYTNSLRDAIKAKQKLFTTEDEVDIFEGNKYYTVFLDRPKAKYPWSIVGPYINPRAKESSGDLIYFSTKEKAEEYILMNKPCLSLNDVMSIMDEDNELCEPGTILSSYNELKDLVNKKLNQQS